MNIAQIQQWFRVKMDNLQEYYEAYGFWKSVLHFFKRLAEHMGFRFYTKKLIFFELDLQKNFLALSNADNVDFVKIKPQELEFVEEYHDGWFDREKALQRLEQGHLLFVMKDQQNIAFFQWIELHRTKIPSIDLFSITLPEKTACMAYIFTKAEYRGRGFASKAKPLVLHYLQEQGYLSIFLVIAPENSISQQVNKKVGFKEYQIVTYRKFLFRNSVFFKYYVVKDWTSWRRKVSWSNKKAVQDEIWKAFSKIM